MHFPAMAHSPTLLSLSAWIWEGLSIFLIVLRFGVRLIQWQKRKRRQQQKCHIFAQGDAWALIAAVFVGARLGIGVYAEKYELSDGEKFPNVHIVPPRH
ncbi:hypothetical protein F4775DRAFT_365454 [Biscogniauxia sp. FL1348]|nr:hypothetical protein F4775DRAFT_365454 [Biscogniauxia sp. FL1348]